MAGSLRKKKKNEKSLVSGYKKVTSCAYDETAFTIYFVAFRFTLCASDLCLRFQDRSIYLILFQRYQSQDVYFVSYPLKVKNISFLILCMCSIYILYNKYLTILLRERNFRL